MSFRLEYVSTEPRCVATYNINRKLLMITNESEVVVYISKNPLNITESGIPLFPYETITFDVADADAPEEAFYAQTRVGRARLRIYEALI